MPEGLHPKDVVTRWSSDRVSIKYQASDAWWFDTVAFRVTKKYQEPKVFWVDSRNYISTSDKTDQPGWAKFVEVKD